MAAGETGFDDVAPADHMTEATGNDRIEDVAPGDVIAVDRGAGEQPYKVVFKDFTDGRHLVTLEGAGETFEIDLAPGTPVKRSLAAKWESDQSPTPHSDG